jgi:hypothetical protein
MRNNSKCGGHQFEKLENGHFNWHPLNCVVCGGVEPSLALTCPGRLLTDEERKGLVRGDLDFVNGEWISGRRLGHHKKMVKWGF